MTLLDARTWLFVPGDRPDRYQKALDSGADVVIVDLEDAVSADAKPAARDAVVQALASGMRIAVRINAASAAADFAADVEALGSTSSRPLAVVLAKAEEPQAIRHVRGALGVEVVPLIESAVGVLAAPVLAAQEGVARLAFGAIDYSLDIGAERDDDVLGYPRSALVVASRAAGLAGPIDSPSTGWSDPAALRAETAVAKRFGMAGKLCIHPAQLAPVADAFAPTEAEREWARSVLAAEGASGAVGLDGHMVDRPVFERARRILSEGERVT